MKGDEIPDANHVARQCNVNTCPGGELLATAFHPAPFDDGLSVNWLERCGLQGRNECIAAIVNILKGKGRTVRASHYFALLNVGAAKRAIAGNGLPGPIALRARSGRKRRYAFLDCWNSCAPRCSCRVACRCRNWNRCNPRDRRQSLNSGNASTGASAAQLTPRTERGKAMSAWNALRHGACSCTHLCASGLDGAEPRIQEQSVANGLTVWAY